MIGPDIDEISGEPASLKFTPIFKPNFIRDRTVLIVLKGKIEIELDRLESQGILIEINISP